MDIFKNNYFKNISIKIKPITKMKNIILCTLLLSFSLYAHAQSDKVEILILGTTHFFAIKDDSITSPKKKIELKQILSDLKAFKPQQIFVESTSENDEYWLKIQQEISKSKSETKETWAINNEIYQVAIKLAESLNLSNGIQGIDWTDPDTRDTNRIFKNNYEKAYFDFVKELRAYAYKKNSIEDTERMKIIENIFKEIKPYSVLNSKVTLIQMYKYLNLPETLKKSYYANRLGNLVINYSGVGAELNSVESFRDYKVYSNALTRINKSTKRVLIIYGSAHVHILKELFGLDPRYKVLGVSQFVK